MKNVLLVGNGVVRNKSNDWSSLIAKLSKIEKSRVENIPNPITTTVISDDNKEIKEKIASYLKKNSSNNSFSFTNLNIDTILTTNYSYEIEKSFDNSFIDKKDKYIFSKTSRKDNKYLIHTYNKVNGKEIWHIHGEIRKIDSMICSINDYGRQIERITKYIDDKNGEEIQTFDSWIDYFINSNLFVVGQGFDYAETDLWWLLAFRKRNKCKGKIIFYEMDNMNNSDKHEILQKYGVIVKNLNYVNSNDYQSFYKDAFKDIEKQITASKKHNK